MSVSNTSGIINQCTYVAQSNQAMLISYFKSFNTTSGYALAFIMNLVQYSPSLISISNNIQADAANCDLVGLYYQVGRIAKILLTPQPLATSSLYKKSIVDELASKYLSESLTVKANNLNLRL